MCKQNEELTNHLAMIALVMLIVLVLAIIYMLRQKPKVPQVVAVKKTPIAIKKEADPDLEKGSVLFLSASSGTRPRCYHLSEKCASLQRCKATFIATACKLCAMKSATALD